MITLPPLYDALLDDATVERLLDDVASCTELVEVIPKHADQRYASNNTITLDTARRLLRQRSLLGLQLRYRYENADWWDTLMVTPQGTRLVLDQSANEIPNTVS